MGYTTPYFFEETNVWDAMKKHPYLYLEKETTVSNMLTDREPRLEATTFGPFLIRLTTP